MNMNTVKECKTFIRPVRDVLDLINGKWKLPILIALSFGNKRFKDLEASITGITPRMLTKELRDLESQKLITRQEFESRFVIKYSLTEYGKTLDEVIDSMRKWGLQHRRTIFTKT
jgi:DNA-binding HxlR family transcriptional regulator